MGNTQQGFLKAHQTEQPHVVRCREILKKHPEIAQLIGRNPNTAWVLFGLLSLQLVLAYFATSMGMTYWWAILLMAYCIGAVANHCLYVVVHEATHNMIFKNRTLNRWAGVIADIPNVVPGAMGFHTYHLRHHAHLGEYENDTDLANHWEARLVGNSWWRKALWLALFPIFQILRTFRLTHVNTWNKWMVINIVTLFVVDAIIFYFIGGTALFYLFFSMMFALGLHPLGARWIQEHYTLDAAQETHSYYGPLNYCCLNMGYHNEHHDFPAIPWNRLPEVKRLAPEYYETLDSHQSWTRLLFEFIFNPKYDLYSRVRREVETDTSKQSSAIGKSGLVVG